MQRFVIGEKYLTCCPPPDQPLAERQSERREEEGGKREKSKLTCERRTDFSPADISKVQQHALLQRVKDVFTGYRVW
jgi:hypothetical protein